MTSSIDLVIESFVDLMPPDTRTDSEIKADKVYKYILHNQYSEAIKVLKKIEPDRAVWFKRECGKSLVFACKDPNAPKELITLLLDKGINELVPLPPDPFDAVEARIPPVVAAECGNLNALEVFMRREMYNLANWKHAAAEAYKKQDFIVLNRILDHEVKLPDEEYNQKVPVYTTYPNFSSAFPSLSSSTGSPSRETIIPQSYAQGQLDSQE